MILDRSPDHGHTEPGTAPPHALGGKKRLKNFFQILCGDADAAVLYAQLDILPGLHLFITPEHPIDVLVRGADGHRPPALDRLGAVGHQVHQGFGQMDL